MACDRHGQAGSACVHDDLVAVRGYRCVSPIVFQRDRECAHLPSATYVQDPLPEVRASDNRIETTANRRPVGSCTIPGTTHVPTHLQTIRPPAAVDAAGVPRSAP